VFPVVTRRTVRVVLADSDAALRARLAGMLADASRDEPNTAMEVVAEATSGEQAARVAIELRPDVVVMDLLAPGLDGVAAIRRIRAAGAAAGVLVMTSAENAEYVAGAIKAGAIGIASKDASAPDILHAIREIAHGRPTVDPRSEPPPHEGSPPTPRPPFDALTPREFEALRLMARGKSNRQLSAELPLGIGSVRPLVDSIVAKLGVADRREATQLAVRHGLR
jgi:DNA-binding NarL/FixJ family response regulator